MKYIKFFNEISIKDLAIVGGKNASLGEMFQNLGKKINIPDGFAVTADGYRYFLKKSGINEKIDRALLGLDTSNMKELAERGRVIRSTILSAALPLDLKAEIVEAYKKLSKKYRAKVLDVAVRSSATAEDLPDASFAGQQESYLNISGEKDLLIAVKKCMASLFTDRAISYRVDKGFTSASGGKHGDVALSVCVQKMVRSDMACSGVMFTIDTESGFKDVILINGSWGLGELVVKGQVSPDEYCIFKPLMGAAGSLPEDSSLVRKATLPKGLGATRPRTKAAVEWLGKRPCRWERQGRADESGRFAPSGLVADESGRFAPSGLVADAKKNNL